MYRKLRIKMFAGRGLKRIWRWDINYEGRKVGHLFCAKGLKTPPCRPKTTLGTKSRKQKSAVKESIGSEGKTSCASHERERERSASPQLEVEAGGGARPVS